MNKIQQWDLQVCRVCLLHGYNRQQARVSRLISRTGDGPLYAVLAVTTVGLVALAEHRLTDDDEIKSSLAGEHPYADWLKHGRIDLDDLPERQHVVHSAASVLRRQQVCASGRMMLKNSGRKYLNGLL